MSLFTLINQGFRATSKQLHNKFIINPSQMRKILLAVLLLISANSFHRVFEDFKINTKSLILWPYPSSVTSDPAAAPLGISPCQIKYVIQSPTTQYIQEVIDFYQIQAFHCSKVPLKNVTLTVTVKNPKQMVATDKIHEKYSLIIRKNNKWELNADYHVGFIRGFETFSQLFELTEQGTYLVNGIPITIDDEPQFLWRGIMIDTSRHFFPVKTIKKLLDGMMYNKMSVLHWHIVDQESFPLVITERPELSQFGSIEGTYSVSDVKNIIAYASFRGVRVVPQIDAPAHTQSWGRSDKYDEIKIDCRKDSEPYTGQFDPTLDLTYEVIMDVLKQVVSVFPDNYTHFGGDQVDLYCWDQRPSIKQFMNKSGIASYKDLQIYFRQQEKKLFRKFSPKKVIYWANEAIDLPLEEDDVVQWWGQSTSLDALIGRKNEIILSSYDQLYLDVGFGNLFGGSYSHYQSWRKMYEFQPRIKDANIIGGQACMWAELVNENVLEQKIWIRSSALAERLWNDKISPVQPFANVVERLVAQKNRMQSRGFKTQPVTVGLCEKIPSICFR